MQGLLEFSHFSFKYLSGSENGRILSTIFGNLLCKVWFSLGNPHLTFNITIYVTVGGSLGSIGKC